jgi:hypothetical protein
VEPFRPQGLEEARQLWWKYFVVAGGMLLKPMFDGRESDLSPILKQFLEWSAAQPAHTGRTLLDAWIRRDALRAQFFAQMEQYPILLCPVAAIPAFRHGERSWPIENKTVNYLDAWSYTEFFNLLGNPAAWFRSVNRRRACPSACRSLAVRGKKNRRCPLPPPSKTNAERGGSRLLPKVRSAVGSIFALFHPSGRVSTLIRTRFHALWADSAAAC